MKAAKDDKDIAKETQRRKTFINTDKPSDFLTRKRKELAAIVQPRDIEKKLKEKIESERHLYDFKYI